MKRLVGIEIPEVMQALVLTAPDTPLVQVERAVPRPSKGEVLVKIESSPVNPSDLSFLEGTYATKKKLPAVAGFEASGQVVACGEDLLSRRLLGRHVACFAPPDDDGTWAGYVRTPSRYAIPLKPGLDVEQGAMLLVNPLTAMAMIDIAKKGNHRAVANTAAAGALGRMLDGACREAGLPLVNIVRREAQAARLREDGASHVIAVEGDDFNDRLTQLFRERHVTLAFDAVAGETTAQLLWAMPEGGEVMVYGGLSRDACKVHPGQLIFRGKKVTGFWLTSWLARQSMFKLIRLSDKTQRFLMHAHKIQIRERVPLSGVNDAVLRYREKMSDGKMIVKPWM